MTKHINITALGETKTFLVSYNHEGARWGIEIQARDFADAQERLKRIAFAQVDGELKAKVTVPRIRWLERLFSS